MSVTQINLIVADLERSREFYAALGCRLRAITLPGGDTPGAWVVTEGFAPVGLHAVEFAAWWDASAPPVQPGSSTVDLTMGEHVEAAEFIETARSQGGPILQELADMPWGQSYAIFADPDGYRWGVKAPTLGKQ